jgi:hypothetical protein
VGATKAADANYNQAIASATVTLQQAPEVKTLILSPPLPGTNDTLTATATTFDADGNTVTLTYVWKNGTTVVKSTANTGSLTDTLDLSLAGNGNRGDTITVEVTPNDGVIAGSAASASVTVVNSPPILSVTNETGSERVPLTLVLSVATDPDGDTLTYSASNLPTGATFDPATRFFSWTPTSAQGGPSPYLVQFTVSDGQLTDTKVASIAVTDTIADRDADGFSDTEDNCPDQYNPDQADVCHNSAEAVTGDATRTPSGPTTNPINVTATFTFTTAALGTSVVRPNPFNVVCRVTSNATGQELPFQTIPEGAPIVLSNFPDGDLIPLLVGSNPFVTTFDLRDWYPTLPEGSYTVVCTYVNFAHIPGVPESGDPTIWMGEANAPPFSVFIGLYTFGGFSSPADHEPFNQGRTVPVKFQLRDSAGALVTTATVKLFVQRLEGGVLVGSPIPATPAGGGTGNIVPFNVAANEYHYNMKTDSLAVGEWQLQAQLDDGSVQAITIVIR